MHDKDIHDYKYCPKQTREKKTSSDQDVTLIPVSLLIKTGNKKRHEEEAETEGELRETLG